MIGKATFDKQERSSRYPIRACAVLLGFCVGIVFCGPSFAFSAPAMVPPSIDELLELSSAQRTSLSPADLSLLCARGLPGEQEIDTTDSSSVLGRWTDVVRVQTNQRLASLGRRNSPLVELTAGSAESRCKAQTLLQVLHDLLGRQPASLESGTLEAAVAKDAPLDPRDLFLSGMLVDAKSPHRPTSVSLPWLYLAVGRRLGYPLRLAAQDGRLLLRWEAPDEHFTIDWQQSWAEPLAVAPGLRFNVEHPGRIPLGAPSDQPQPASPSPMHLLTADDEIAMLLGARGACLESHGENREALVAYAQAHRLSPDCDNYLVAIAHVMPKISTFFGHTEPMPAPDYSDRGGPLEEVNALNRINLQRQQDDEERLRQVMEENRRALKARQDQRTH